MIRRAEKRDASACLPLIKEYLEGIGAKDKLGVELLDSSIKHLFAATIDKGECLLDIEDGKVVGIAAGLYTPIFGFNLNERIFQENIIYPNQMREVLFSVLSENGVKRSVPSCFLSDIKETS